VYVKPEFATHGAILANPPLVAVSLFAKTAARIVKNDFHPA
jgi:hypothetical protein